MAINFATEEDKKILYDFETFYNTTVEQILMNVIFSLQEWPGDSSLERKIFKDPVFYIQPQQSHSREDKANDFPYKNS